MTKNEHLFPYEWRLSDGYPAKGIKHHGCKVFGTFICGGGSTMGYKLAGYNHLGGVELDPKVAAVYKANHHPQMLYVEDIRDFNKRDDLPAELYQLDLLDGSPPCSTFSTAGSREKAWGKEKHFAEGQKLQRLDDLVFVYCDTIAKLKPKVCLLENVSGLVKGNGKVYAKEICKRITEIGYRVQVFLLNASTMGVPQRRERVFFIGLRKDFHLPKLVLNFNEKPISFRECSEKYWQSKEGYAPLCNAYEKEWHNIPIGGKSSKYFQLTKINPDKVWLTVSTGDDVNGGASCTHHLEPRKLNKPEMCCVSTFPLDYQGDRFGWLVGMSVPPVMTAQISHQIYLQWLCKLK